MPTYTGGNVSQFDMGVWGAPQSAKGVYNNGALKGVMQDVKASTSRQSKVVPGERALGKGPYTGPGTETSFNFNWQREGRVTMKRWASHFFGTFLAKDPGVGSAGKPYLHKWKPISDTRTIPWWTWVYMFGLGPASGEAIGYSALRDARTTQGALIYNTSDAFRFRESGMSLQEGLPAVGNTYSAETANIQPQITSPDHVLTYPTAWAAFSDYLCLQGMQINYNPKITIPEPCATGTGETTDILFDSIDVEVDLVFQYNDAAEALYRLRNWGGNTSPAPGTGASRTQMLYGDFDFEFKSLEHMDPTGANVDLDVPYTVGGHLPLEYASVDRDFNSNPATVQVKARCFEVDPTWFFYLKTDLDDTQI